MNTLIVLGELLDIIVLGSIRFVIRNWMFIPVVVLAYFVVINIIGG